MLNLFIRDTINHVHWIFSFQEDHELEKKRAKHMTTPLKTKIEGTII